MRAKKVGSEQLERIIRLREANASWLAIGKQVGIDRRTVKKAYEDWKESQTQEELLGVRKEIAAEDFRDHRDFIITLASYLVDNLGLPDAPIKTNSEQFFSTLWQENILRRWGNTLTNYPRLAFAIQDSNEGKMKRIKLNVQENEQIFKSLLVHTEELNCKVTLYEWESARDQCIEILGELREKALETVKNLIKQPRFRLDGLEEGCREKNPLEGMVEAVVQSIWIKDEEKYPLIKAVPVRVEQTSVTALKVPQLRYQGPTFLTFTENSLAQKVAEVCNQVVINLCKGEEEEKVHTVRELHNQISIMKRASEELAEMLSPLKLRPIILRTKCDLCPV